MVVQSEIGSIKISSEDVATEELWVLYPVSVSGRECVMAQLPGQQHR